MPIQFLWGDEDYLIENHIAKIKKEVLKGDVNELNYKTVDSPSFPLFSELLRTNPMMFGDTVIVIKCQKYFLSQKNKVELDEKQTEELIKALKNVSDKVHIILVCETPRGEKKKPDSRKKLYKELQKITKPIEFPSYRNYEDYKLIPIIKKMADELDLKIGNQECSFLVQTTGSELRLLHSQLEKLKLYSHPKNIVTKQMIETITTSVTDVFSIVDYILKKDYTGAIKLISDVIEKEYYAISFALIQSTISSLLKTKILSQSRRTSYEIATKTGQNEFVVKKNIEKLRNVQLDDLIRLKINLTNVEYMLRTGTITNVLAGYEMAFLSDNLGEKIC